MEENSNTIAEQIKNIESLELSHEEETFVTDIEEKYALEFLGNGKYVIYDYGLKEPFHS